MTTQPLLAKPGDYVINHHGIFQKILTVETGLYGGYRCGKYSKWWIDQDTGELYQFGRGSDKITGRIATEAEVKQHLADQEIKRKQQREDYLKEQYREQVKEAGPRLLEALTLLSEQCDMDEPTRWTEARRMARDLIAELSAKATL